MTFDLERLARLALTVGAATLGGWCAFHWHVPLPWVLGPMAAVACVSMANRVHKQPVLARKTAQIYIGASIGLYFTPAVLALIGGLAPWMIFGAFVGIFMSILSARALQKLANVDGPTAIYSVALGASAEMSVQAQRAGADGAVVASAHAVRIMMVTSTASYIAWASGATPIMPTPGIGVLSWPISIGLLVVATFTGWCFQKVKTPNPWVLGALLIAAICANHDIVGRLPDLGLIAAQVVIGWGLGQHINRAFFTRAPRTLASVAVVTLGILAVCMAAAWLIARGSEVAVMTAFLSMAPGGMTEMGILSFLTKPVSEKMMATGWVKP